MLIIEMDDNIKAFKLKLLLWDDQSKPRNNFPFSHLQSLDTVFPERIKNIPSPTKDSRTSNSWMPNFNYFFLLNAPESLQKGSVNFQCDTDLNQKLCEIKLEDFSCYLLRENCPLPVSFG